MYIYIIIFWASPIRYTEKAIVVNGGKSPLLRGFTAALGARRPFLGKGNLKGKPTRPGKHRNRD